MPERSASRPLYRRPKELGRRVAGVLLGFVTKAWGAAGAVSVALGDAETIGGKAASVVNPLPTLVARYDEAKYVVEHRAQIQSALDYVQQHAPDPGQLEAGARKSSETLDRLTTTYGEVTRAWDALSGIRPQNILDKLPQAKGHFDAAWAAKPDLDSLERLTSSSQEVAPFLRQLEALDIDFPKVYRLLLRVTDNFASDEIVTSLIVMAVALTVGYVLSLVAGFWGRRGRPGFVAATLQRWGARLFRDWHAENLEYALGYSWHAVARQRIEADIVANPRQALTPDAYAALAHHFRSRPNQKPTGTSAM